MRVAGGLDYGMMCEGESNAGGGSLTATSSGSGDLRVRSGGLIMHADSDLDIRTPESQPSSRNNLSSKILLYSEFAEIPNRNTNKSDRVELTAELFRLA